jgi:hypothetical protein
MTPSVHRITTHPSTALQYIGNIILNLLLMAAATVLLFGVFLFT